MKIRNSTVEIVITCQCDSTKVADTIYSMKMFFEEFLYTYFSDDYLQRGTIDLLRLKSCKISLFIQT